MPEPYEDVGEMAAMIILKCIRSDKIVPLVRVSKDNIKLGFLEIIYEKYYIKINLEIHCKKYGTTICGTTNI